MGIVNISRATNKAEPVVTMTLGKQHAEMLHEMASKTAATGKQARTLAELYEMAGEAVDVLNGTRPIEQIDPAGAVGD